MKKLRICNRGDNLSLQQTMKKSIQFIQCLTIINENAEVRRSLRTFPVVAWLGLQTRVISKAIENEIADAKETFTVHYSHISTSFHLFLIWNLHSSYFTTQFLFFTIFLPSKHSFLFSLYYIFFSFLSHHIYKTNVSLFYIFYIFFSMLARFFKSCGTYRFSFSFSPTYFLLTLSECSMTFYGKRTIIKSFRVSRKKIFEISLYFKLRFNCLSSKGLTNTLSAHR